LAWYRNSRRGYYLYQTVAFVVLIPVAIYEVVRNHVPPMVLAVCIPAYLLLSRGAYEIYKNIGKNE
jgi:hypothetical protein